MKSEFCIIGGGIAGLSTAYELSSKADVVVLERETDLAYHTTGRSASLYSELYIDSTARALTKLSRPFLMDPPVGFSQYPLHQDIGCIFTATIEEMDIIKVNSDKSDNLQLLDIEQMLARVPVLRTGDGYIQSGLFEKGAFRIDVAALVDGYRKQLKTQGGEIRCNSEVTAMTQAAGAWKIRLANNEIITTRKVINAAGAWGDVIAKMAGIKPLGLTPLRRTIIIFDGPENTDITTWPAVFGINGGYYFMPEAGKLIGSAADEVVSPPCDAQPEEYDIALAAHNIETNTTLDIKQIQHKWAGLRTFSPDRQLVAGYEPDQPDFFWLVGQGGFGIQTAPAVAHAVARLALEEPLPAKFEDAGITAAVLSRQRVGESRDTASV